MQSLVLHFKTNKQVAINSMQVHLLKLIHYWNAAY